MISRVQFVFSGIYFTLRNAHIKILCNSHDINNSVKALCCVKEFKRFKYSNANQNSSITETKEGEQVPSTFVEKVKQNTKDASYLGIILCGIGVTGVICYAVFRELFSKSSPNSVYTEALKRCKNNDIVIDAIGSPIMGFGEETARGRRRHVSSMLYEKEGVNYMRMKFYVKGSRRKGTVHLEVKENERRKYEYRYLFVELDGYPQRTIILEDNRFPTHLS